MNPTHRAMLKRFGSNSSLNRAAFTSGVEKITVLMGTQEAQDGLDALEDAGYIYAVAGGYMLSHAGRIYLDGPGRVTPPRTVVSREPYVPKQGYVRECGNKNIKSLPMGRQLDPVQPA